MSLDPVCQWNGKTIQLPSWGPESSYKWIMTKITMWKCRKRKRFFYLLLYSFIIIIICVSHLVIVFYSWNVLFIVTVQRVMSYIRQFLQSRNRKYNNQTFKISSEAKKVMISSRYEMMWLGYIVKANNRAMTGRGRLLCSIDSDSLYNSWLYRHT